MSRDHSPRFLALVESIRKNVLETDVPTVARRREAGDRFHLVDVREESEFAAGHLPGAVHLGKGIIERDAEATFPQLDDEIVLYCGGGFRSVLAADALAQMGYENVISMDGGFRGWADAGHPIEMRQDS